MATSVSRSNGPSSSCDALSTYVAAYPERCARSTTDLSKCVLPAPLLPQMTSPVSLAALRAKRISASIASTLRPGTKVSNVAGGAPASENVSCSGTALLVAIERRVGVRRPQVAQRDQQRRRRGQRE